MRTAHWPAAIESSTSAAGASARSAMLSRPGEAVPPAENHLAARLAGTAVTAVVVLTLAALLLGQYALLWHLLFVPWLDSQLLAGVW